MIFNRCIFWKAKLYVVLMKVVWFLDLSVNSVFCSCLFTNCNQKWLRQLTWWHVCIAQFLPVISGRLDRRANFEKTRKQDVLIVDRFLPCFIVNSVVLNSFHFLIIRRRHAYFYLISISVIRKRYFWILFITFV